LPDVSGVAAASTAAAMIIRMNEETSGNGSIAIHHLHKMREGEARGDGDREMYNAVVGILEETIMSADSAGDTTELLEVAADVFRGEAIRDR
jgi:hypothetical protein